MRLTYIHISVTISCRYPVLEESEVTGGSVGAVGVLQRVPVRHRPSVRPGQRNQHSCQDQCLHWAAYRDLEDTQSHQYQSMLIFSC